MIRGLEYRLRRTIRKCFSSRLPGGWRKVKCQGVTWRLNPRSCVGSSIIESGGWEHHTTRLVRDLVKPGMHVVDVGANFGYFALICAQCVGANGLVWAFEPARTFREQLDWHVRENRLTQQVRILPFGLSELSASHEIALDQSTATLHVPSGEPMDSEQISLRTFDDVVHELSIERIDFVKVDIDGHEPFFLRGAENTLRRFRPPMVIEFAQSSLYLSNWDVRRLAERLRSLGYVLCNERTRRPFATEFQFLMECENFDHSANVLAVCAENCPDGVKLR